MSKGPQHDLYELAPNMWGEEFVPQPSILPQVDLVITHAGNNTTTECMHFGKPMIALPLFWDQYDNAQRVDDTGFGARLRTYAFEPEEMSAAIDRLLGDGSCAAGSTRPRPGSSEPRHRHRGRSDRARRGRVGHLVAVGLAAVQDAVRALTNCQSYRCGRSVSLRTPNWCAGGTGRW